MTVLGEQHGDEVDLEHQKMSAIITDEVEEAAGRCARLFATDGEAFAHCLCRAISRGIEERYGGRQFDHQARIRDRMMEILLR